MMSAAQRISPAKRVGRLGMPSSDEGTLSVKGPQVWSDHPLDRKASYGSDVANWVAVATIDRMCLSTFTVNWSYSNGRSAAGSWSTPFRNGFRT